MRQRTGPVTHLYKAMALSIWGVGLREAKDVRCMNGILFYYMKAFSVKCPENWIVEVVQISFREALPHCPDPFKLQ